MRVCVSVSVGERAKKKNEISIEKMYTYLHRYISVYLDNLYGAKRIKKQINENKKKIHFIWVVGDGVCCFYVVIVVVAAFFLLDTTYSNCKRTRIY